jgi:glycosyltransferase involved in cell wall biosynthesis
MTDLSEQLAARGHRVDVVTSKSLDIQTLTSDLPRFERLDGVNVYRYASLRRSRNSWRLMAAGQRLRRWPMLGETMVLTGLGPVTPGLAWHIASRGHNYDVVHLQTLPYAHVVYGYASARLAALPVVITPHLHVEHPESFSLKMYGQVLRGADLVIVVTEREIPYLLERGVRRERIIVAGNGVRLDALPRRDAREARRRLGLPEEGFMLLFLGRKVPNKGLNSTVHALRRLRERHPSLFLVSAGPGTDQSRCLKSEYSDLKGWIDLDAVSEDTKLDLLNACDALILPSTEEAFGIVFLEAWAVGKPVIGARAGGIPWVIDDGRNGLLVEPNDECDIARKVELLVTREEVARSLGADGARKVAERFTAGRIAGIIEGALASLVERRPRGRQRRAGLGARSL